jgi:hypothetical protein
MAKTAPRAILLRGRHIHEERPAGGAIMPGHFLSMNSSGLFVVNATAGADVVPIIAVEDDHNGKGIDDAYASGDLVQAEHCAPGMEVNALVAAGAAAIAKGAYVEMAADGTVRVYAAGKRIGRANVAVDNSGGATPVRLPITTL